LRGGKPPQSFRVTCSNGVPELTLQAYVSQSWHIYKYARDIPKIMILRGHLEAVFDVMRLF